MRLKKIMGITGAIMGTVFVVQSSRLVMTDDLPSDLLHLRATLPPPTASPHQTTAYSLDLHEFMQACIEGNLTAVQAMHALDPDLLSRPLQEDGSCSIHFAANHGHKELLDYIITHDLDTLLIKNKHGSSFIDIMQPNLADHQQSYAHKQRSWGKIENHIKTQPVNCTWVSNHFKEHVGLQIEGFLANHADCQDDTLHNLTTHSR